ncbi:MAG: bifunctional metallophosphatase/5'-nucleotidase, partial [Pseudomonadota bacterium]
EVDVVISGHTHQSYICQVATTDSTRTLLLTSAGQYGTLLTHVRLSINVQSGKVVRKSADNLIVQGEAFDRGGQVVALRSDFPVFPKDPTVAALIERYAAAAAPLSQRVVGRLGSPMTRRPSASRESTLGNLIADAQLAATQSLGRGGAQIAFMNPGGVRADLVPAADGSVTYGQLFSTQPFGNSLVVKTLTGAQLRRLLEQQFASGTNTVAAPRVLYPSVGFSYACDLSKPEGARISDLRLRGAEVAEAGQYRVAMNSFLAAGGDNFSVLLEGVDAAGGGQDVDAFEEYIQSRSTSTPVMPPALDRIVVR